MAQKKVGFIARLTFLFRQRVGVAESWKAGVGLISELPRSGMGGRGVSDFIRCRLKSMLSLNAAPLIPSVALP